MSRWKKTDDYLKQLEVKGYSQYAKLFSLYLKWKEIPDIAELSDFLDMVWKEKDNITPKYLSGNTYNNLRGTALEECCFIFVSKIISAYYADDLFQVFWNKKIATEEFFIFKDGKFQKYIKSKALDIVIGQSEGNLCHPLIIISCKISQMANWLDEDRAIFDSVRNRYPNVVGYSLCWNLSASPASIISGRKTGLRVFDLSRGTRWMEFTSDIMGVMHEMRMDEARADASKLAFFDHAFT